MRVCAISAATSAGVMNLVQMSRSLRAFLSNCGMARSVRGKIGGVNSAFAWFAVHLIRPPATFSPSDAEKELFCGTIS